MKGVGTYQHYTLSPHKSLIYERCHKMDSSDTHLLIETGGTAEIPHM